MATVCFRFDIDTHKCIRDGVPNLLKIAKKYQVPFTFFLNVGKSVNIIATIKEKFIDKVLYDNNVFMLSAREKLGLFDYFFAAIINPNIISYKKQIKALFNSNCEIGIHGGKNHSTWSANALSWSHSKIKDEIKYAIEKILKIIPDYKPYGFASPCWITPYNLPDILKSFDFLYYADFHMLGSDNILQFENNMPLIGVNLLGEGGGVAFWENCRAQNMNTEKIHSIFVKFVNAHPITVVYDHSYYAGVREIESLENIIEFLLNNGHNIIAMGDLLTKCKK